MNTSMNTKRMSRPRLKSCTEHMDDCLLLKEQCIDDAFSTKVLVGFGKSIKQRHVMGRCSHLVGVQL